jgi:Nif-specific regulatory protein
MAAPDNHGPTEPMSWEAVHELRRERELYRTLLELGTQNEIEALIETALGLIAESTGAKKGYLELLDEHTPGREPLHWHVSVGCSESELQNIRQAVSSGIIAAAIASGEPMVTPSALSDQRFKERRSVKLNRIEAVLCVPIGSDPVLGVLYLQDRGPGGSFTDKDVEAARSFSRYFSVFAERLLMRRRLGVGQDPTLAYRKTLHLDHFVGRSAAIAETLGQVALVAPLEVSVLLTGPSGTGKTELARILHDNGKRARQPFVELNCAALPETLLESELFGAMPGAHSTASRKIPGKLEAAEGGTLFLDEIGELPLSAQAKLLQFLQSHQYFPLGSTKAIRADVRVIAATNLDLKQAVKDRRFREDLLYRLEVLPIRVPGLRERNDDIVPLMEFFCTRSCQAHSFARLDFSPAAVHAALSAEWPGNIRQLAHAVEAAVIRAGGSGARSIERTHLFPGAPAAPTAEPSPDVTFQEATRLFQEQLLRRHLDETNWNVTQTAERLDLARSHVYNLIKAFGLEKKKEG